MIVKLSPKPLLNLCLLLGLIYVPNLSAQIADHPSDGNDSVVHNSSHCEEKTINAWSSLNEKITQVQGCVQQNHDDIQRLTQSEEYQQLIALAKAGRCESIRSMIEILLERRRRETPQMKCVWDAKEGSCVEYAAAAQALCEQLRGGLDSKLNEQRKKLAGLLGLLSRMRDQIAQGPTDQCQDPPRWIITAFDVLNAGYKCEEGQNAALKAALERLAGLKAACFHSEYDGRL